jgi:hypothetical protein
MWLQAGDDLARVTRAPLRDGGGHVLAERHLVLVAAAACGAQCVIPRA